MNRYRSHLAAAFAALALAGCASGPKGVGAPRPAMVQPIGKGQELGDAVSLLDQGNEKAARKKLEAIVKRDPGDARARLLLDSLNADPVATLGAKSFDHRVEPGETMQSLAQHYLGDRLKFYLLARYNGIAVPEALKTGQVIHIPGDAPRLVPVEPRPRAAPPPQPVAPPAKRTAPKSPVAMANPRRAAQLRGAALAALNKGQVGQAVALFQQALTQDPGNAMIQRDLERARRIQQTVRTKH